MFKQFDPVDLGKQIYVAKKCQMFYSFLFCKITLTRISLYKDKIVDSVLIRENDSQWKLALLHILRSKCYQ